MTWRDVPKVWDGGMLIYEPVRTKDDIDQFRKLTGYRPGRSNPPLTFVSLVIISGERITGQRAGNNKDGRTRYRLLRHDNLSYRDHESSSITKTDLERMLSVLTDKQREAVVRRHIFGMTETEIARSLTIPLETVRQRYLRGMNALRRLVA